MIEIVIRYKNMYYLNYLFTVMSKKIPKFQETLEARGSRKKKQKSAEYYKQRQFIIVLYRLNHRLLNKQLKWKIYPKS